MPLQDFELQLPIGSLLTILVEGIYPGSLFWLYDIMYIALLEG